MPTASGLEHHALAAIARRCADETDRFFRRLSHDPGFCFELFRRALVLRVELAWEHVYEQYRPLVSSWVERHSAFSASGEEVQYFVNRAFEKMWQAVTPEKFGRFPELKSLLRYLQMCVHSVVYDLVRRVGRAAAEFDLEGQAETAALREIDSGPNVEGEALARVQGEELWQQISSRMHTEKERCAIYGSFVLGLPPREVYALYDDAFEDVSEVYRAKENVLARLRRDDELLRLLGAGARERS
jgi:DNA-directed RNA polymerase specialized sigma24 family protein